MAECSAEELIDERIGFWNRALQPKTTRNDFLSGRGLGQALKQTLLVESAARLSPRVGRGIGDLKGHGQDGFYSSNASMMEAIRASMRRNVRAPRDAAPKRAGRDSVEPFLEVASFQIQVSRRRRA